MCVCVMGSVSKVFALSIVSTETIKETNCNLCNSPNTHCHYFKVCKIMFNVCSFFRFYQEDITEIFHLTVKCSFLNNWLKKKSLPGQRSQSLFWTGTASREGMGFTFLQAYIQRRGYCTFFWETEAVNSETQNNILLRCNSAWVRWLPREASKICLHGRRG